MGHFGSIPRHRRNHGYKIDGSPERYNAKNDFLLLDKVKILFGGYSIIKKNFINPIVNFKLNSIVWLH